MIVNCVVGMGIGTIHAQLDHALANRARSPPGTMSVAIGGKLRYYAGRISVPNIRQFIRNLLPQNLITRVSFMLKTFQYMLIFRVSNAYNCKWIPKEVLALRLQMRTTKSSWRAGVITGSEHWSLVIVRIYLWGSLYQPMHTGRG